MKRPSHSETPATQFLKADGVAYTEHFYDYVERGGTAESSQALGVPVHEVVKALVMEDEQGKPLVVLMHGDRKVSTKNLARQAGCKRVEPAPAERAQRHSGYQVGGTSPFGTRKRMPVFLERSILELPRLNSGCAPPPGCPSRCTPPAMLAVCRSRSSVSLSARYRKP